jgi:predicted small lipoprotein YifL
MWRGVMLAALVLSLTACGSLGPVMPPTRPTTENIIHHYADLKAKVTTGGISVPEYVASGYRDVDAQCDLFFQRLAQARRTYSLVKSEMLLGIATGSTILALLQNSAQT